MAGILVDSLVLYYLFIRLREYYIIIASAHVVNIGLLLLDGQ